jgi:hypothetical protein
MVDEDKPPKWVYCANPECNRLNSTWRMQVKDGQNYYCDKQCKEKANEREK